jgi:hypothetical protein
MKTKPITLIVSLLLCLSRSVFADTESINLASSRSKEFFEIRIKQSQSHSAIMKIMSELQKVDFVKSSLTRDRLLRIYYLCKDVHHEIKKLDLILGYEYLLLKTNSDNKSLKFFHTANRNNAITTLKSAIEIARKVILSEKVQIQNIAAVLELNKQSEILNELTNWIIKNENFRFITKNEN